jgi:AraC-like DNA-binding protein
VLTREKLAALCAARDALVDDGPEPPTVHEVAARAGVSTGLFIRQFAALFGETPHQLRVRSRLEWAKRLLAGDTLSVTEICFEVGFASVGSFSAQFRRRVGVTPTAYRAQHRGEDLTPSCLSLMGGISKKRVDEGSDTPESCVSDS